MKELSITGGGINALLSGRIVKSVQKGTASVDVSGTTVNISEINVSKSILIISWALDVTSNSSPSGAIGEINSSTTVYLRTPSSASGSVSWQVIEFY